jgi:hypothetical protein
MQISCTVKLSLQPVILIMPQNNVSGCGTKYNKYGTHVCEALKIIKEPLKHNDKC